MGLCALNLLQQLPLSCWRGSTIFTLATRPGSASLPFYACCTRSLLSCCPPRSLLLIKVIVMVMFGQLLLHLIPSLSSPLSIIAFAGS